MYWGGNPAECHPRHFTKYTIMQKSKFLPRGRKDRTMVLVDIRETKSAKAADMPLVYGLSNTTCEAQKECAAMADLLGGILDSHTSL